MQLRRPLSILLTVTFSFSIGCASAPPEESIGEEEIDIAALERAPFVANVVEKGKLYRGRMPIGTENLKELRAMGIKTIVDLREPTSKVFGAITNRCLNCTPDWERDEAKKLGLGYVRSMIVPTTLGPVSKGAIEKALETMMDPEMQPVYVHCIAGEDRTGLMSGLYRVEEQNWTPKSAYAEMLRLNFRTWMYGHNLGDYFMDRTGLSEEDAREVSPQK